MTLKSKRILLISGSLITATAVIVPTAVVLSKKDHDNSNQNIVHEKTKNPIAQEIIAWMNNMKTQFITSLQDFSQTLFQIVKNVEQEIKPILNDWVQKNPHIILLVNDLANDFSGTIKQKITDFLASIKNSLTNSWNRLLNNINQTIEKYSSEIFTKLDEILTQIKTFVETKINNWEMKIETIAKKIAEIVANNMENFQNIVSKTITDVSNILEKHWTTFKQNSQESIKQYVDGLIDQLKSTFKKIGTTIATIDNHIQTFMLKIDQYLGDILSLDENLTFDNIITTQIYKDLTQKTILAKITNYLQNLPKFKNNESWVNFNEKDLNELVRILENPKQYFANFNQQNQAFKLLDLPKFKNLTGIIDSIAETNIREKLEKIISNGTSIAIKTPLSWFSEKTKQEIEKLNKEISELEKAIEQETTKISLSTVFKTLVSAIFDKSTPSSNINVQANLNQIY